MSTRKLGSIRKVSGFTPIEKADNIHLIHIDGWRVVARKEDFKIGDLCVYIEVDSLIPATIPQFKFLEKWGTKKVIDNGEIKSFYRIKTQKLRGAISQGLAVPVSSFPELSDEKEGEDVTNKLGLMHYDPESPMNSYRIKGKPTRKDKIIRFLCNYWIFRILILPFIQKERGAWPEWIPQTDEERIQNLDYYQVYEQFKDKDLYTSEKIDYQSATFFTKTVERNYWGLFKRKKKIFGVCSRTKWLKTPDNSLWWKIARKYNIEKILREYQGDLYIQGEQGNQQVQGNKYNLPGESLFIFNVVDFSAGQFSLSSMEAFCRLHNLQTVPILDKNFRLLPTVEYMVELSKGSSILNPNIPREGIVIRIIENGAKLLSFKIINPEFDLKFND